LDLVQELASRRTPSATTSGSGCSRPPAHRHRPRDYDAGAIDRLRFIQGAQRLGLRLVDIGHLLAVRDTGHCPCEPAGELLRRRLDDVDAEIARLTELRAEMAAMAAALPQADCPAPTPGTWCPPEEEGGDCSCPR
jgi:DNA-binding transcriptional MerR regulator